MLGARSLRQPLAALAKQTAASMPAVVTPSRVPPDRASRRGSHVGFVGTARYARAESTRTRARRRDGTMCELGTAPVPLSRPPPLAPVAVAKCLPSCDKCTVFCCGRRSRGA